MKKYIAIIVIAVLALGSVDIEARRRGGGGFHGGHRWSGHGGWRRGRGWGWGGPGVGFGLSIPLGGGSKYVPEAPYQAGDPYYKYRSYFPKSDPVKNKRAYRRWLFSNYPASAAEHWWNNFLNYRYNPYQASKPRPSAYFSIGGGSPYYGGYPYYGYGYPYRYGGRPYGGIGFGFGF